MENRGGNIANRVQHVLIGCDLRSGQHFFGLIERQRLRGHDLPRLPDRGQRHLPVGMGRQVIRFDLRLNRGVWAGRVAGANALRAQIADRHGDRRKRMQRIAQPVGR